jgi:carbon storage regulator CsrA
MEGFLVLTLTRSVGETIRIGDDIEVHVVEVRGGTVRLGFKAPREVTIHREEVYRQIAEANLRRRPTTRLERPPGPSRRRPVTGRSRRTPRADRTGRGTAPGRCGLLPTTADSGVGMRTTRARPAEEMP